MSGVFLAVCCLFGIVIALPVIVSVLGAMLEMGFGLLAFLFEMLLFLMLAVGYLFQAFFALFGALVGFFAEGVIDVGVGIERRWNRSTRQQRQAVLGGVVLASIALAAWLFG